jgi:hypothetical protein
LLFSNVIDTAIGKIIFEFLVPAGSFGVLGLICSHKNPDGVNRFRVSSLVGAIVGVFIGNTLPYVLLWFSALNYNGGGANIGIGILVMATPILVIVFGAIGFFVGYSINALAAQHNK